MGEQVRVRFVTEHDQYRVTDAPFVLPQKFGRKGLSEVINHLLEPSPEHAVPFDFSINGQLLRTQLKTFLVASRVNLEEVVSIEYMPALSLSDESKTADAPAWVGSLSVLLDQGQHQQKKKQASAEVVSIIAGCYDGTCTSTTHSAGGSLSAMSAATPCHADPVRAVKTWQSGGRSFLATASKDMTLKCWSLAGGPSGEGQPPPQMLANLSGHFGSVESVDFWGDNGLLLSGDWAGNICGWGLAKILQGGEGQEGEAEDEDEEGGRQSSSRRKKTKTGRDSSAPAAKPELRPALTIRAHSQCVSSICVGSSSSSSSSSPFATIMLSASWDHSIKTWDLNTQDCTATLVSNKVVTSLSLSSSAASSGAVLTAHPDGKCRLWDLRSNTGGDCRVFSCGDAASASAGQWVSQVAWHPSKSTVFASADYAGVVRLWDTRASTPLGAVEAHDGKALCCAWAGEENLLSGGSDCKLVSTPLC
jgi:ribosome biogenesis protein YTM1